MSASKKVRLILVVVFCVASLGFSAEPSTTQTFSLTGDLSEIVRERIADYKPLVDRWRKKSGYEMKKLEQWEYKVVSVESSDPLALSAALNQSGQQGWECFHVSSGAPLEPGELPGKHLLFFRKRKGSWISQLPLREIVKIVFWAVSESGEGADGP